MGVLPPNHAHPHYEKPCLLVVVGGSESPHCLPQLVFLKSLLNGLDFYPEIFWLFLKFILLEERIDEIAKKFAAAIETAFFSWWFKKF